MWPFKSRTYELVIVFTDTGEEQAHKIFRAREALSQNLRSGRIEGGEPNLIRIFSQHPKLCFGEAGIWLEKEGLRPQLAKFRAVEREKWIQLLSRAE
jgi:hypothetical protein